MPAADRVRSRRFYDACKRISKRSAGYSYGGGHGTPISYLRDDDALDCSSSCSLGLHRVGLFNGRSWVLTSGGFAEWGLPGRGRTFTVWYRGGHVFVVFHGPRGGYRRFDTSPWGPGRRGPRIRRMRRPTVGFRARHWPGL